MAKVSVLVHLFVFHSLWHTMTCQRPCNNNPCACCKNKICDKNSDNVCTDGCIDGIWGDRCYNNCPTNCKTCTLSSRNNGLPCTSCIPGKYIGRYQDRSSGSYNDDCSLHCRSECISCSSYNNCSECVSGRYGTSCSSTCNERCEGNECDKEDGTCKCKAGYNSFFCKNCTLNEYGQYPDCAACPTNCLTCSSSVSCDTCKDSYYNNYTTVAHVKIDDCSNPCRKNCKTCSEYDVCSDCHVGFWGNKCKNSCSNGCAIGTCNKKHGYCKCKTWWFKGDRCEQCIAGKYGNDCNNDCLSLNCGNNKCDRLMGTCSSCKVGYYGNDTCDKECPSKCKSLSCDFNDGECTDGCISEYSGDKCCLSNNNCETCFSYNQCLNCKSGYSGDKCDRCPSNCVTCSSTSYCRKCKVGYYGYTCERECSDCKNGTTCRLSNGYCEGACKDGKYGRYCTNDCDNGCSACLRNSWSCTMCANGRHGKNSWNEFYNCVSHCSSNCLNNACNGSTGYCDTCIEGYKGDLCDCPVNCQCSGTGKCSSCDSNFANINMNCSECALHKYGVVCQSECSNNCLDNDNHTKCHGTNGTCLVGCVNGFNGEKCDSPCDENCVKGTCSRLDGICSYGCKHGSTESGAECVIAAEPDDSGSSGAVIGGYVGAVIAVLAIIGILVFVFLRRRLKDNDNIAHTYENTRHEDNDHTPNEEAVLAEVDEGYEIPMSTLERPSVAAAERTHEYEEMDEVPPLMHRPGLSADHDGEGVVIETVDVNTYEPLSRSEMHTDTYSTLNTYESLSRPETNTDVYSQLEQSAYENTTI